MVKLDEYDLKMLYLLRDNARLSISELSHLLNLSRPTIKSRIERLEKEGIIQKYTIKVKDEILEAKNLILLLVESDSIENFDQFEEITEVNKISKNKFFIKVWVATMNELKRIIDSGAFDVLEIFPVIERKEKEMPLKIKITFKCDYCGKEIEGEPIIYKYRNKVYFFCCNTCLREYKRMIKQQ
ncbi:MAG: TRASH domain-containing protein [Candidatus Asgardarchaeia archaeon]